MASLMSCPNCGTPVGELTLDYQCPTCGAGVAWGTATVTDDAALTAGSIEFGWNGSHAPTPVGRQCLHCNEPIGALDRGYMQPHVGLHGWELEPLHAECQLRMVLGSVGHIEERCSCYCSDGEEDPPGLTRREAAVAAVAAFERRHGTRVIPA